MEHSRLEPASSRETAPDPKTDTGFGATPARFHAMEKDASHTSDKLDAAIRTNFVQASLRPTAPASSRNRAYEGLPGTPTGRRTPPARQSRIQYRGIPDLRWQATDR